MNSVKEIRVTDEFRGLEENEKQCQTTQTIEQCLAQQLLIKTMENCKCIPYELQNFSKSIEVIFL